jgi:hypothetical protein
MFEEAMLDRRCFEGIKSNARNVVFQAKVFGSIAISLSNLTPSAAYLRWTKKCREYHADLIEGFWEATFENEPSSLWLLRYGPGMLTTSLVTFKIIITGGVVR